MHKNSGKSVAEILVDKKGSIKQAALGTGSPSWDEIREVLWEEIDRRAKQNVSGYRTIRKLLSDPEYDK